MVLSFPRLMLLCVFFVDVVAVEFGVLEIIFCGVSPTITLKISCCDNSRLFL